MQSEPSVNPYRSPESSSERNDAPEEISGRRKAISIFFALSGLGQVLNCSIMLATQAYRMIFLPERAFIELGSVTIDPLRVTCVIVVGIGGGVAGLLAAHTCWKGQRGWTIALFAVFFIVAVAVGGISEKITRF